MNKSDLLKELRALTQAPMQDCLAALKETNNDLEKAVDFIKIKGQNVVSGRDGKIATEGIIIAGYVPMINKSQALLMLEVNCETDFVAKSKEFRKFAEDVWHDIAACHEINIPFDDLTNKDSVKARNEISSKTKEKCLFSRWWIEESIDPTVKVFGYVHHPADKLAAIVTLKTTSKELAESDEFKQIGNELAMQIVAMNPIAVSPERLSPEIVERQKAIFEEQVKNLNKPAFQKEKIIEGKLNKWYTEVCLLKQDSVLMPKTSVEQLIKNDYRHKLGGEFEVINFIRAQVGEGLTKPEGDTFAAEVANLSNVPAAVCPTADQNRFSPDSNV